MKAGLWALVLIGCPAAEPPGAEVPCGAELAVGTGTIRFQALSEGDDLEFVHGPQGGYHLPLAVRTCRIEDPGMVRLVATLAATGEVVSEVLLSRAWTADGDCCAVLLDVTGYLTAPRADTGVYANYEPFDPAMIDGQHLVIDLEVTDGEGGLHASSLAIQARRPPA